MLIEIAIFSVVFLVLRKLFTRNRSKSSTPGIPKATFPAYSLYNILRTVLSDSRGGKAWEILHSDVLQTFSGFAALYPKEKIIDVSIGLAHFVLLTTAESVEEFLMSSVRRTRLQPKLFAPWFGKSFTVSIGQEWKSRRKFVMPIYRDGTLQFNVPKFDRHSKAFVNILKQRQNEEWIDIRNFTELYTLSCAWEIVFGSAPSSQTSNDMEYLMAMKRVTRTITKRAFNPILSWDFLFRNIDLGRQFYKDISFLRGFIKQVIKQRKIAEIIKNRGVNPSCCYKDSKQADLLSMLLEVHFSNLDFTEEDITDEIAALIFGSQDTTSAAMAWALYLIGLHPDVQSKIHEELDSIFGNACDKSLTTKDLTQMRYLECVIKECQRLYPSIPFNGKRLLEDTHISGHRIKKGAIVVTSHYVVHRNPKVFSNPEIFDPNRFLPENCLSRSPFSYIPFSAGDRACLGRRFVMVESQMFLANILRNFSVKSLDHRDKIRTCVDLVLHSVYPLKLKFTPRYINVDYTIDETRKFI